MRTTHNLEFFACDWPADPTFKMFRVGTCEGQWYCADFYYAILSVKNSSPGNGHLEDVFEWFEASCKRDNKALRICELMNEKFKIHLIKKRGFIPIPNTNDLIKLI